MQKQIYRRPASKQQVFVIEMSIDDLPEEASLEYEPHTILQRKIEFLMQELGCSEQAANRMVFGLLG